MRKLPPGQTLQPTDLVHEIYLRLAGAAEPAHPAWNSRGHYFGAAARAMRQILVDQARRKLADKRGGRLKRVDPVRTLEDDAAKRGLGAEEVLALHDALERLEHAHPRKAQIVQLRYFAGLTTEQIAESLGVTTRTVEREWRFAKAWLGKTLAEAC